MPPHHCDFTAAASVQPPRQVGQELLSAASCANAALCYVHILRYDIIMDIRIIYCYSRHWAHILSFDCSIPFASPVDAIASAGAFTACLSSCDDIDLFLDHSVHLWPYGLWLSAYGLSTMSWPRPWLPWPPAEASYLCRPIDDRRRRLGCVVDPRSRRSSVDTFGTFLFYQFVLIDYSTSMHDLKTNSHYRGRLIHWQHPFEPRGSRSASIDTIFPFQPKELRRADQLSVYGEMTKKDEGFSRREIDRSWRDKAIGVGFSPASVVVDEK